MSETKIINDVVRVATAAEALEVPGEDDAIVTQVAESAFNSAPGESVESLPGPLSPAEIHDHMWSLVEAPLVQKSPVDPQIQITITQKDGLWAVSFDKGYADLDVRTMNGPVPQSLRAAFHQLDRMRRLLSMNSAWDLESESKGTMNDG